MKHTPDYGQDYLGDSLAWVTRYHHLPFEPSTATAGLPLPDGGVLTPKLFVRAAKRCGLQAKVVARKLSNIPSTVLPAVLINRTGTSVSILTEANKHEIVVIDPSTEEETRLTKKEAQRLFSGYAIYVKPEYQHEERADLTQKLEKQRHWFWSTIWGLRGFYGRVATATVVINLLALASSLFIMNVYDRVVPNQAVDTLYVLAVGAAIAYGFEFFLKNLRTWLVDRAGHRADLALGSQLFEQILGLRYEHRPASAGSMAAQARSYEHLREFFTSASVSALADLPFVILFAVIVYGLGGMVAIPMVVGALLCLIIGFLMQWPIQNAVKSAYQATNQRQAMIVESLNALETIKICGAESYFQSRMENCMNVSSIADGKSRRYSQLAMHGTGLIQQFVAMAIVVLAYFQVTAGTMTMGAMIAAVILSGRGMAPLAMLASLTTRWQQSRKSLSGLNAIMELPNESQKTSLTVDFEAKVSFKDISFNYPGQEDLKALSEVNLDVQAGERIALLGGIGSGKSTLLRLLLGLYHPTGGHIELSNIDMRQLSPHQYREHMGYIAQEPVLVYGTLRDNLVLGRRDIPDDLILLALKRAGLLDWVNGHPKGLDMQVAEGGASMSGGQRKCVSLARALVHQPDLLIFDEPSNGMDSGTERHFMESISNYLREDPHRTLIMATHRRSLLQLVDRVVVLEGGKIAADGPTDQLLKRKTAPAQPSRVQAPANNDVALPN